MRIAIIQFPGSNCERETALAIQRVGMEPLEFLWNESPEKLVQCAGFVVVGGFSYEDRLRAGKIAALDPLMQVISAQVALGKPLLGICNGAQILVESGLVPGLANNQVGIALTDNKRMVQGKVVGTGFYNAWVNMRVSDGYQLNAFTRHLTPKQIISLPVAHGEGRFVIPPALLKEMQENGLTVFQYCDTAGNIIDEFPINPNGSICNMAGVSNKAGNVLALMPHPERTPHGDAIFASMRDYIASGRYQQVPPLYYQPRAQPLSTYQPQVMAHELLVDLVITDNQAMSVESALHKLGYSVKVQRFMHWEVVCDSPQTMEKVKASGLLYNNRKEKIVNSRGMNKANTSSFLVRAKDDMVGQQKQQLLANHFAIPHVPLIRHSIVWSITHQTDTDDDIQQIIHSPILFNEYAHDCFIY